MVEFPDNYLSSHYKLGFKFPIKIGEFRCESLQNAKKAEEDLFARHLQYFQYTRKDYDPLHRIERYISKRLKHIPDIEHY